MRTALITGASRGLAQAGLAEAVDEGLDLLVNNASTLGAVPLPRLADYPLGDFARAVGMDLARCDA